MDTSGKVAGVEAIRNFEISPDTLSFTQGKDAKNTKIKQFLCVRHIVPKTNLYQTILLENRSHDRMLEKTLSNLSMRKLKCSNSLDLTARTFMNMQERKQKKWRREDEMRLSSMNLPTFHAIDDRPQSADVMYHMPEYTAKPKKTPRKPPKASKIPKMPYNIRKEQTEIITYKGKTLMSRMPEVIEVDQDALKHYDQYRGKRFLYKGVTKKDTRYDRLQNMLSPAKVTDKDMYPTENIVSSSRLAKYSPFVTRSDDGLNRREHTMPMANPEQRNYARWMLTQPESISDTAEFSEPVHREVRFQQLPERSKKSDQILQEFRTKDVKKLAMTLNKTKTTDLSQSKDGKVFVPGVNIYFTKTKEEQKTK
ncbi:hypothetical protein FSP39_019932 [Pinctada imbricata]|uniref:Uncharacterized protein n=1 Tax=Pinctada imbricata TaxID=66713 RepID=A0AA89BQC0_PINIB|nr:hypothetical protein FSP39_019932 [Pinctada imbricata]